MSALVVAYIENRPPLTKLHICRTETKPGKHPDTRIKPLPLANGHGRCMAVAPEQTLVSSGE
jgi:hypothetical protein